MNTTFAQLTTLAVGGPVAKVFTADSEASLIAAITEADRAGIPLVVLGGGSNIVAADEPFDGIVVCDGRREIRSADVSACGGATVTASAGVNWDEFVQEAIARDWIGVEALSGIPGSVGATPVQNVGAYGQQVSDSIAQVRTFDRDSGKIRTLFFGDLKFGYRTSVLKESMQAGQAGGDPRYRYTPRYVVLSVTFQFKLGSRGAPIRYGELAARLGVAEGERVAMAAVREQVLAIRASKGMVLDPGDRDTFSAGSFFTNPIVDDAAAARLPEDAPAFRGPQGVKLSAAWLISHAGIDRGFALSDESGAPGAARVSTKHSLAITNAGGASQGDVLALAYFIRDRVWETFAVELIPEPLIMGSPWRRIDHK